MLCVLTDDALVLAKECGHLRQHCDEHTRQEGAVTLCKWYCAL